MNKNPHAVALGRRTSPRKAQSSARNGRLRPPLDLTREEWQAFALKCGDRNPRDVARELIQAYAPHAA